MARAEERLRMVLERMFQEKQNTDVVIKCGGKETTCHYDVLANRSIVFELDCRDSYMKAQPLIVNLDDELAPGLGIVLQYLYSLRLPAFNDYTITFDTALAVLKVSGKFAIPELRDEACRYLEGVCERWLERNEWSNGKNKSTSNYLETFREIWKLDFVGADKLRSALVIAMAEQSPELILLDEFENWLREDMDFNMAFMKAVCKAIRKRRYELAKT